jgi:hypothetical protein
MLTRLSEPVPGSIEGAGQTVIEHLPSFVYYSNYGNLDFEIYLPHVIENLTRSGLGAKEAAKVRTLKVLFEFVGRQPNEILQLGKDAVQPQNRRLTDDESRKRRSERKNAAYCCSQPEPS